MNKRIAIPVENGVLCSHFGHCKQFAIVDLHNNQITQIDYKIPPEHQPGLYPVWISQQGVTDVIAGGMGQQAIHLFNQQKINVFVGAPVKKPSEIIIDFISDKLTLNANYCNH